jgi:hypothetical protein
MKRDQAQEGTKPSVPIFRRAPREGANGMPAGEDESVAPKGGVSLWSAGNYS